MKLEYFEDPLNKKFILLEDRNNLIEHYQEKFKNLENKNKKHYPMIQNLRITNTLDIMTLLNKRNNELKFYDDKYGISKDDLLEYYANNNDVIQVYTS